MDDKTLLERAAKAAGIKVHRGTGHQIGLLFRSAANAGGVVVGVEWNPLDDDGDCARMEAALLIDVYWSPGCVDCAGPFGRTHEDFSSHNNDRNAARRRAAVRAAAAMAGGEE